MGFGGKCANGAVLTGSRDAACWPNGWFFGAGQGLEPRKLGVGEGSQPRADRRPCRALSFLLLGPRSGANGGVEFVLTSFLVLFLLAT